MTKSYSSFQFILLLFALILAQPHSLSSQTFGKNQLVVRDFPYQVWETDHFYIYYYEDNPLLLEETAKYLEAAYTDITARLDAKPNRKLPFFLYTNHNEFEQTRIVRVGEGTGGVTEAFKDRFLVFNNGSMRWLRHVIFHEFAHEVQFAVLNSGFWKSARLLKMILYPLWIMEGMAEYMSGDVDLVTDGMYARDLATSRKMPAFSLKKLHNFNHLKPHQVTRAYKQGAIVMKFIAQEYGEDKMGKILKSFWERFDVNAVLLDVIGADLDRFDRNFKEWLEETYGEAARGLDEPTQYGEKLTKPEPPIPIFRHSPVVSSDGKFLYFIALRGGFPAVYQKNLESGKKKIVVGKKYFKLDWIALSERNLAISADDRYLYFVGEKNLKDNLYRYDVAEKKLEKRHLKNLIALGSPAVDPKNPNVVAISGMESGFTDIYEVDFDKGETTKRITSDPQDDNYPVYTPDGENLIYSTEVYLTSAGVANRNLYVYSRDSELIEPLTRAAGVEKTPAISPDGSKMLFVSDAGGVWNMYEMELDSGKVWRRTNVVGAMFSPSYTSNGDIVYASFRDGEIEVYSGSPNRFLNENVTRQFKTLPLPKRANTEPVSIVFKGGPRSHFGTDLFFPAFFFSTEGGLFALAYWQGSDILGYNNVATGMALNSGAGELDYSFVYNLAKYRTNLSLLFRGLQTRDPSIISDQGEDLRKKEHLQAFLASYPFDRFHRVEAFIGVTERHHSFPNDPVSLTNLQELGAQVQFVRDTATAPYLVVTRGSRFELGLKHATDSGDFDLHYWTRMAEWHQYIPFGTDSTLASRMRYRFSHGRHFQVFPLGGRRGVRGFPEEFTEHRNRGTLTHNLEYRFPLFSDLNYHMWFMFPDFYFKNIYLGLFSDQGVRWTDHAGNVFANWSTRRKSDLYHAVGFSVKFNTFILQTFPFFVSFDWAKRTTAKGGVLYGSIFQFFRFGSLEKEDKF